MRTAPVPLFTSITANTATVKSAVNGDKESRLSYPLTTTYVTAYDLYFPKQLSRSDVNKSLRPLRFDLFGDKNRGCEDRSKSLATWSRVSNWRSGSRVFSIITKISSFREQGERKKLTINRETKSNNQ